MQHIIMWPDTDPINIIMLIFLIMYFYIHFLGERVLDCIEIYLQSMFLSLHFVTVKLFNYLL